MTTATQGWGREAPLLEEAYRVSCVTGPRRKVVTP